MAVAADVSRRTFAIRRATDQSTCPHWFTGFSSVTIDWNDDHPRLKAVLHLDSTLDRFVWLVPIFNGIAILFDIHTFIRCVGFVRRCAEQCDRSPRNRFSGGSSCRSTSSGDRVNALLSEWIDFLARYCATGNERTNERTDGRAPMSARCSARFSGHGSSRLRPRSEYATRLGMRPRDARRSEHPGESRARQRTARMLLRPNTWPSPQRRHRSYEDVTERGVGGSYYRPRKQRRMRPERTKLGGGGGVMAIIHQHVFGNFGSADLSWRWINQSDVSIYYALYLAARAQIVVIPKCESREWYPFWWGSEKSNQSRLKDEIVYIIVNQRNYGWK